MIWRLPYSVFRAILWMAPRRWQRRDVLGEFDVVALDRAWDEHITRAVARQRTEDSEPKVPPLAKAAE